MAALVGDFVDPDPAQSVQPVNRRVDVGVDARHDRPDRAPRDAQQFHHRTLGGAHRQPGREIVEVAGVAGAVAGPRHRRDRHPMITAPDPRRVGLEKHFRGAQIECSPPATTGTEVIAR